MSAHPLHRLFSPVSVAIVGAGEDPGTVGAAVMRNLADGGYRGALYPVHPRHASVLGRPAFRSLAALPTAPDLVVLATPAATLPDLVREAGDRGAGGVAILTSGLNDRTPADSALLDQVARTAREARVRVLGPNSLGLLRPSAGLNASFARTGAKAGAMALVSQSGGLASAMLDWAMADGLGFSSVVSLGNQLDVDFSEVLDFLTADPLTDSIVLYVEGVRGARRFMSALRAAARIKPVVVLKSGRGPAGSRAATTHTGAMAGPDEAFDAALRRAGAVRVTSYTQLFAAAKYLSSRYRPVGRHLAIVTNGGGPGVMAVDRATEVGLLLSELAPATHRALDAALPASWSGGNPVDVLEDASPERYRLAIAACLADEGVDGVVAIVTPQAMSDPDDVARSIAEVSAAPGKPVIACFMGETSTASPLRTLQAAGLPAFSAPEPAVEAFANIVAFYNNQRLLMQVPGPLAQDHQAPDLEGARALIDAALAEGRTGLTESESKGVLAAFRIPVAATAIARSLPEAISLAQQMGFPVAMKVHSPDLAHKSDVGGVRLDIGTTQEVRTAYLQIEANVRAALPEARIEGIAIEPMVHKPHGREVMVGVSRDPVFGPVIALGAGGTQVELIADRAVALPPLNGLLARNLIDRTRVAATLRAWRGMPPASLISLEQVLLRVSEMVCELPWLAELDINPLILDEGGAVAADARIVVGPVLADTAADRYAHMAICPYPGHLARSWVLEDGREVFVRPIRPEDAEMEQAFVRGLSEESRYFRFANALHELSERMLVRFTQIDYDRELALVAVLSEAGVDHQIAVARYVIDPDGASCEFALAVADDWHGKGIGTRLLGQLIDVARARGLRSMIGYVLGLAFQRIQFTSDLLPADIVGVSVYDRDQGRFDFHPGPVFSQVVLADEVNRATPKAQSALLEAMEEHQVTVDGQTRALPAPFFVIATQNPSNQVGTYPLPESQLDRFLMRIHLGYPDAKAERALLGGETRRSLIDATTPVLDTDRLLALQAAVRLVHASPALLDYVQALLTHSRQSPAFGSGLSPRAGLSLLAAARAWALIDGRNAVLPEDIQAVLPGVAGHRLLPPDGASGGGDALVRRLVDDVAVP